MADNHGMIKIFYYNCLYFEDISFVYFTISKYISYPTNHVSFVLYIMIQLLVFYMSDLNRCRDTSLCKNGGTCINTDPDKFRCDCQPGFTGDQCQTGEYCN